MIEQIKHLFIKETSDGLQAIQKELLSPTADQISNETVEKIYRAMHTIKGSGPMFGYNHLTEITLPVEIVYRNLRDGHLLINHHIIDKTKDVVSLIQDALKMKDEHLPSLEEEKQMLIQFFKDINRLNDRTND